MDGSAFDRLTRAVSTAGSRRRLLGIVASVGLGGVLTRLDKAATKASSEETQADVGPGGVLTQMDGAATPVSEETTEAEAAVPVWTPRARPKSDCERQIGPNASCSETSPCCPPARCEPLPQSGPRCCLPPGANCNTNSLLCCSHSCNGNVCM